MTRPRVTLKLATSLDGRIATARGESRWITGPEARAATHALRADHDAVLVGIGTALADDPLLTARTDPPPERQPCRIILDSRLRLPVGSKLVQSLPEARLIVVGAAPAPAAAADALRAAGADVIVAQARDGAVDIGDALARLAAEGVGSILVEGGGKVAAALIGADAVDRIEWFRAPIVIGAEGAPAIGALALQALSEAPKYVRESVRLVGVDLWESLVREERGCSPAS